MAEEVLAITEDYFQVVAARFNESRSNLKCFFGTFSTAPGFLLSFGTNSISRLRILLGHTGDFNVVNRPPPVIAGLIQTERQNHACRPRGIVQFDGDGLVGGVVVLEVRTT